MRRFPFFFSIAFFALIAFLFVQSQPGDGQEKHVFNARIFNVFQARNIGPANMGGRIVDLAVVEKNPDTYYVAAATGGVWKTTDGGSTWAPLTDHFSCSIGAVAVSQSNPDVVWVGTGEANPRNSVTWGDGVYKSTDGGKSWTHMGLKETHHIGRIVIHPSNPDIVYVAALGHIWAPNAERGLFKTTDGGKTWQHVLKLDAETGVIDVAIDLQVPDTLYAAAYAVKRDGFSGGDPLKQYGPKAGLYKTTDGGAKWDKMTNGLPANQYGRCGVHVWRKDPNVVFAVVQSEKTGVGTKGNPPNGPTEVADGGIFRSNDRGATWTQLNSLVPRPFYYGQIRVDPSDDQRIYVLGTAFHMSADGGKTFSGGPQKKGAKGGGKGAGTHPDHHALWINPRDTNHLILGNDGGLYISKNKAANWTANRGMPLGQFYAIAVDMKKPYRVYGGLQDNGSWGGPSATRSDAGITLADWKSINGADGFHCQCDPNDVNTVYAESQYGNPVRVDVSIPGKKGKSIKPKSDKTDPIRFNWSAPMLLSPHNSKTVFYGGNYLFRSEDRGDSWKKISPDLTAGKGGTTYKSTGHTLTTVAESPKKPGVIYTGSDDGRVYVTRDGGQNWTDVSAKIPGVPKDRWVTRVECSHHDEATAYLTIGRYRNDDHKPYVFKTTDFGATWTSIANNLPDDSPINVIRESSRNPNLLFLGTEYAVHVSLDGGKVWHHLKAGLPVVPIHDLVIHPRERDLVIGTHGRSIYCVNIGPLEELTREVLAKGTHLFSIRSAQAFNPAKADARPKSYVAPNPEFGASIYYYLSTPAKEIRAVILDGKKDKGETGKRLRVLTGGKTQAGLHRIQWDLMNDFAKSEMVAPGEYLVELVVDGQKLTQNLRVEAAE
jgi:photosystem II stability/assembly factor-like uncharacterized protein